MKRNVRLEGEIRRLHAGDAEALWKLRLQALDLEPNSFAETAQEFRQKSAAEYAKRLASADGDNFVFGGFEEGSLVGMTGFYRLQQTKERHKGRIWGVYVAPQHRGKGLGRAILTAVLEGARQLPDLSCITLSVARTQEQAKRLYLDLGFRVFGVEPRALRIDGRYVEEAHMILEL